MGNKKNKKKKGTIDEAEVSMKAYWAYKRQCMKTGVIPKGYNQWKQARLRGEAN